MRDAVHVTKEGGSMRVGEFECGWVDERAGEWVEQAWHDHTQAIRGPYTDHTQAIHGPYAGHTRTILTQAIAHMRVAWWQPGDGESWVGR